MLLYRSHSFYYGKSQNGKRYPFANVKKICHLIWKTFWHLDGANSMETAYWTCNLQTGQSVSLYSVLIEFALWKCQKKIQFVNWCVCHFFFCHDRKNGLSATANRIRINVSCFREILADSACFSFFLFFYYLLTSKEFWFLECFIFRVSRKVSLKWTNPKLICTWFLKNLVWKIKFDELDF